MEDVLQVENLLANERVPVLVSPKQSQTEEVVDFFKII